FRLIVTYISPALNYSLRPQLMIRRSTKAALFPYTTLFRSMYGPIILIKENNAIDIDIELTKRKRATLDESFAYVVQLMDEALPRSEEHTSELQSREKLVCRLLLEKKNKGAYELTQ